MLDIEKLTLEEIMEILNLQDTRSVKKWLMENNIPISQIGRTKVVNRFMFELKQQQLAIEELKISYPNNWFEIYEANTPDEGMVKAISILYPQHHKVKRIANHKNKFIH